MSKKASPSVSEKYLSIGKFAERAGVSYSHVYKHLQEYSPVRDEGHRWVIPESSLTRVLLIGVSKRGPARNPSDKAPRRAIRDPGLVASKAVKMFDDGKTVLDVVRDLEITIAEARTLRREYDDPTIGGKVKNDSSSPLVQSASPYNAQVEFDKDHSVRLVAFVDWGDEKETYILQSAWYDRSSPEGRALTGKHEK